MTRTYPKPDQLRSDSPASPTPVSPAIPVQNVSLGSVQDFRLGDNPYWLIRSTPWGSERSLVGVDQYRRPVILPGMMVVARYEGKPGALERLCRSLPVQHEAVTIPPEVRR